MLLRRTLLPSLGSTLISEDELGISKRLFRMKLSDGAELEAFLLYDSNLGAVLKLTVKGLHGEDVRAEGIAESLRKVLAEEGAVALEEVSNE
jgi:hypothetical protein